MSRRAAAPAPIACRRCDASFELATNPHDVAPELTQVETAERAGWLVSLGGGPLAGFVGAALCPKCHAEADPLFAERERARLRAVARRSRRRA